VPTDTARHGAYYGELRNLLNFYDGRAAFERSAQLIDAAYKADPIKDKFDYLGELAWRYELLGQTEQQLATLRQYYNSRTGDLVVGENPVVTRYLELLHQTSRGDTRTVVARTSGDELRQLAGRYSPYQFQLINFFIERGEEALALEAIAHAICRRPGSLRAVPRWRSSSRTSRRRPKGCSGSRSISRPSGITSRRAGRLRARSRRQTGTGRRAPTGCGCA
jgi:hypothetical protein